MASVNIPDQKRTLVDAKEICEFLKPFGVWYEKWEVAGRLPENPSNEQILETYAPEIERLKTQGNFVTADVINVNRDTPGLDTMLDKFKKEHTHSEDEVRFTVSGRGVFHLHPEGGPVFAVTVESGDLINVPCGMQHWFNLCDDRHIRCIRLFQDVTGWTPHYIDQGVHESYAPMCFGPQYVEGQACNKKPVISV
jgi:1,2-dihydroxy-3-keto-5-methylthiopentene dioxygenase